jgi:dihydrofolate synthase/folylpolyglutamate synthase
MLELGSTVEAIAGEKAGIIKRGTTVICHPQEASVAAVIEKKCRDEGADVFFVGALSEGYNVPLLGTHQRTNAAVAVKMAQQLGISDADIRGGLAQTRWPGRFEILCDAPVFIVDAGHNTQGVATAVRNFAGLYPGVRPCVIFGVLDDKEYVKMLEILRPLACEILYITPPGERALPAEKLGTAYSIADAIRESKKYTHTLAVGSLAAVGEIRNFFTEAHE